MVTYINKKKVNSNVVVVNYSNECYTSAQKTNRKTALNIGLVKKVISFSHKDIDEEFYLKNKEILEQKRGGGYWLWKPYFIKKALLELGENEILFYCDSGSKFVNSVDLLIDNFKEGFDIVPFELQFIEKHWTKRDCFQLADCDTQEFTNSKQILATFSLWKKSEFTISFAEEWLKLAQDPRVLTDMDNQLGLPNHEGFVEHRHDQSIFSLLIKKHKIIPYRDPSIYGTNLEDLYLNSNYPQILISTRQRNISFLKKIKKTIYALLPKKVSYFYTNVFKNFLKSVFNK
jgi:hypothetical protein